jgi:hypothetical protein
MPTEDYSHMVMENKHMVNEDGVGDDDGVEALEIPLLGVESRICSPRKRRSRWWRRSGSRKIPSS